MNISEMAKEEKKYERILNILRKSKPLLAGIEDIEERVMNRIRMPGETKVTSPGLFDYLFSWVYVGWVRRSLITASVLIVIAFGYQQTVILKQINALARYSESQMVTGTMDEIGDKLLLYKLTEPEKYDKHITVSDRQMKRLIESVNELQVRYDDLIKLIEENPELKKYINEKLTEKNRKRLKL